MYVVDPSLFCTSCASTSSRISLKYVRCERISPGRFFALIDSNMKCLGASFSPSGDTFPAPDFLNHCGIFISGLSDEAEVGRVHVAHVVYSPAQTRETVEPHAECEALIFVGVHTRVLEYLRMHHARAHHFYPTVTQFFGRMLTGDAHVHLHRRLGERKEARAETDFHLRTLE